MAETFLAGSTALLVLAAVGLAPGIAGRTARGVTAAGSLVLVAGAALVGHTGGQLVYRYGAAQAYATSDSAATGQSIRNATAGGDDSER
jgi:hypothetical protein